jgi:hypothetical protein
MIVLLADRTKTANLIDRTKIPIHRMILAFFICFATANPAAACDLLTPAGALERFWEKGDSEKHPKSINISEQTFAKVQMKKDSACYLGFDIDVISKLEIKVDPSAHLRPSGLSLCAKFNDGCTVVDSRGDPGAAKLEYLLPQGTYVLMLSGDDSGDKAYDIEFHRHEAAEPYDLLSSTELSLRLTDIGKVATRRIRVEENSMIVFSLAMTPKKKRAENVEIGVRDANGLRTIPPIETVDSAPSSVRSAFVLKPGDYFLDVGIVEHGWPRERISRKMLATEMLLNVENIVPHKLSDSMLAFEAWLDGIGLGYLFELEEVADNRDPDRGLPRAYERLRKTFSEWPPKDRFEPEESSSKQAAKEAQGTDQPVLLVALRVKTDDREMVEAAEYDFQKRNGIPLWNRVLQKLSALESVSAKKILVLAPVWCSGDLVFIGEGGGAYRHGAECMSASASVPVVKSVSVASATTVNAGKESVALGSAVRQFLPAYVNQGGAKFEFLSEEDGFVEVMVRGLRGHVIPGGSEWEKLQLTFFLTGDDEKKLRVSGDGHTASGIGSYPADSHFTRDIELKSAKSLQDYVKRTALQLRDYLKHDH